MAETTTQVPFTLLTGFLGAGKTTLLNRMLAAPQGRRIAVLVNELGRISIDTQLIVGGGGDVLELAGGCLCCKIDVKNDLWEGIGDIIQRSNPDHVVLETTGIAEPGIILDDLDQYLARDASDVAERVVPAGVITVVDASAGTSVIDRRDEAREQIAVADRILLSKLDIASADSVEAVHGRLDALESVAERASFPDSADGTHALVQWMLERRTPRARPKAKHSHRHGQVAAACYEDTAPLTEAPLRGLIESMSDRLLRVKGFVHLAGDDRRAILELASGRVTVRHDDWGDDAPHTQLVFIGEDLDEPALKRALWACRAAAE